MEKKQYDNYLINVHEVIDRTEERRSFFKIEVRIGHVKGNLSYSFSQCDRKVPEDCYMTPEEKVEEI